MLPEFEKVKGIHPGAILKRELKKRKIKGVQLAGIIKEHPQTINAIINERRGVNPGLSIKLGIYFNISENYFMILQAAFEVKKHQSKSIKSLNTKIRSAIFWDTDIEKIDWIKSKRSVIKRVLERGNHNEIMELINFYSLETVKFEIKQINGSFLPSYMKNIYKYINK